MKSYGWDTIAKFRCCDCDFPLNYYFFIDKSGLQKTNLFNVCIYLPGELQLQFTNLLKLHSLYVMLPKNHSMKILTQRKNLDLHTVNIFLFPLAQHLYLY